ncbi:type VII secretion target [Streptomyces sp. NPDC059524]|uniref:type VII secretion target n=1 Tax=Streptomyces sp. NPDC059524 TaxID=3346856 RepID=UPI0036BAB839
MTLRVTPSDLEGYARQVGRAHDDAVEFKRHCERFTRVGTSDVGILNHVTRAHAKAVTDVTSAMDQLVLILKGAATELRRSAVYYEKTDRRVAANLDATYPRVKRPVS